jgi:hypothetical protein
VTKLHLFVRKAGHFLKWERQHFERHFELVPEPAPDAILFAFGPDVLEEAAALPALRRAAMLFPGFDCNPVHNLEYRAHALTVINESYDVVFFNSGPLAIAYAGCEKGVVCPFSVDTSIIARPRVRHSLDSLLHVSADSPQKDWPRSEKVMQLTGLRHEVFPPRGPNVVRQPFVQRLTGKINRVCASRGLPRPFAEIPYGYVDHAQVVRKYLEYDGFVHIADEVPLPKHIDGKYTAALAEAGLSGAIVFWHDTLGTGNEFETVFDLPVEPEKAAQQILDIRGSLDIARHSAATREELLEKFDPRRAVDFRCQKLKELL